MKVSKNTFDLEDIKKIRELEKKGIKFKHIPEKIYAGFQHKYTGKLNMWL